ncbi:bifunctional lytic transglycosylase/C40 family peptidase [Streptomyces sp. AV19]|uniref:bifunctional lytic transglycosylase/C40 family peptidase n=1 Tax=Streptomyces sp. AV19 TaxID=2793068 RepID=UPI002413854A|nr:bifunctional lytic transglycosylase/C40 family peptidase [Streptomyces sp. AV19]
MRKWWVGAGVGVGMCLGLLGLLFFAVYTAAMNIGGGVRGAVGLAKGAAPADYQPMLEKWGNLCPAITPALLAAQLYTESNWDPKAKSPAGALGLAQFIPETWAHYGVDGDGDNRSDVWNPHDAIASAATYDCALAKDVKAVGGDATNNMLAAYNAGPYRVIDAGGIPRISETQGYVKSIRDLEKSFARPVGRVAPSQQAAGAIYFAQEQLGKPYLWGGDGTKEDGGRFDCSGLTKAAYASVGIELPRVANDQWNAGPHPKRDELMPGDLVFFAHNLNDPRSIHHVGLYVGGGYMINAPHTGAVNRFDKIDTPDYIGATRVTDAGAKALPRPNGV